MPASRPDAPPEPPVLVLFRNDLRLADNAALNAAVKTGRPVLPVFVFDDGADGGRPPGGARRWWLHHALERLCASLSERGAGLILRRGPTLATVLSLLDDTKANAVFWNRRYDPAGISADSALKTALRDRAVEATSFDGQLLHEPSRLTTTTGGPYKVYSPFWRALVSSGEPRAPVAAPKAIRPLHEAVASDALAAWSLLPTAPDWAGGLRDTWTPGEAGARQRLADFLDARLERYAEGRDRPAEAVTSRLSPHLVHGEITPFQIWHALARPDIEAGARDLEKFRKEVAWREFSYHLLFHNRDLASKNVNRDFDDFAWRPDAGLVAAWQQGRTGYPIVDAGMRQLWRTGWMHNRVRMVAASFLTKHLLQHWREGEVWFWDTLVDADPASNPASWQWVAGSGADAAPYFRIFNPVLQGEKFDPDGVYVREFVPELARLPDRYIHKPWEAPADVLSHAGVKLGTTYPVTIVEHRKARAAALAAYDAMKGTR
ncbi:deoxyribodipyrimidine photo-lyase [Nitratireductor sp. StC3]|uniref:cryptochrome/photolyase family protein n=1 Tax=Nitratireductor sp. StC3 TaxID=2126741 RepID=UPI000D0DCF9C|nr:deoxyribodipyrimidine photo-lyase [Nitratireductor sp. StC3]PSM18082.1 deoxyribodipyrimidine photolyase [Nitratireductor sp. StC3]